MLKYPFISQTTNVNLSLYQCGMSKCAPRHAPSFKTTTAHYLFHFILDGSGTFYQGSKQYRLTKGQGFLIYPNEFESRYIADEHDPWTYAWVCFDGLDAEEYIESAGFSKKNHIYTVKTHENVEKAISDIVYESTKENCCKIKLLGLLYLFMSALVQESANQRLSSSPTAAKHVQTAVDYILSNFMNPIEIAELADKIKINRSYLCRIFKEKFSVSPQTFILCRRIDSAKNLLKNSELSIGEVAKMVGYENQLAFSRIFKKHVGISPKNWREQ